MVSGCPRPATAGSASCAPASASLRISGMGLISLFSGMKPETIASAATASGSGRSAIAWAAAARMSAGRRIAARERFAADGGLGVCNGAGVDDPSNGRKQFEVRSRDGRWSVDPGFPTKVGGRHVTEPTSPVRDSSLEDR